MRKCVVVFTADSIGLKRPSGTSSAWALCFRESLGRFNISLLAQPQAQAAAETIISKVQSCKERRLCVVLSGVVVRLMGTYLGRASARGTAAHEGRGSWYELWAAPVAR